MCLQGLWQEHSSACARFCDGCTVKKIPRWVKLRSFERDTCRVASSFALQWLNFDWNVAWVSANWKAPSPGWFLFQENFPQLFCMTGSHRQATYSKSPQVFSRCPGSLSSQETPIPADETALSGWRIVALGLFDGLLNNFFLSCSIRSTSSKVVEGLACLFESFKDVLRADKRLPKSKEKLAVQAGCCCCCCFSCFLAALIALSAGGTDGGIGGDVVHYRYFIITWSRHACANGEMLIRAMYMHYVSPSALIKFEWRNAHNCKLQIIMTIHSLLSKSGTAPASIHDQLVAHQ